MRDRAESGGAIKEAELEEVANAEVDKGAEVGRDFMSCLLFRRILHG